MKTTWQRTYSVSKKYQPLEKDLVADVVIVGGGITGITSAYLLAKAGKKVIVLEKGALETSSATAYTTGFLTAVVDTSLGDLKKMFGPKKARAIWQAGADAIDTIDKIITAESIDCDFRRCPEVWYAHTKSEWRSLEAEALAIKQAGWPIYINQAELPFETSGSITIPNQAKFHAIKYAAGLRQAAEKYSARFFEATEVLEFEGAKTITAKTKSGSVKADYAIIATYAPFNKPIELFARKGQYTSYVYELAIPTGTLPEGLYLDSANPYHYFRVDKNEGETDTLMIGGEDHRKEIPIKAAKNWQALEAYAQKILGNIAYKIVTKWDGAILETLDGLPLIGRYSKKFPNRLVATGFSGNGMTYSIIAAEIMSDIICGTKNAPAGLFNPRRGYSPIALYIKGKQYLGELFGGGIKNMLRWKKNKCG